MANNGLTNIITSVQRFSIHDGDGIRTTVFFKGCPLRCLWCHNPETQHFAPEPMSDANGVFSTVGTEYSPEKLMDEVLRDRPFFDESGGGVTFSGGEPLCAPDFIVRCLEIAQREGIGTAVDTTGAVQTGVLERVMALTDMFLYDFKVADAVKHREFTGIGNTQIIENLGFLIRSGARVEVRLPLVAGLNTSERDIDAAAEILVSCGVSAVKLLAYHDIGAYKYERLGRAYALPDALPPSEDELARIAGYFGRAGISTLD